MDDRILQMIGKNKGASPQELFEAMDKHQMQLMKQVQDARTEEQKEQLRADLKYLEEQKEVVRKTLKLQGSSNNQKITQSPIRKEDIKVLEKKVEKKPVGQPTVKPMANPVQQPAAKPVVYAYTAPQQAAKPVAKPASQLIAKPVVKQTPNTPTRYIPKVGNTIEDAKWNYNHECYREAFQEFSQLANHKDAEAAYYLSICYAKGRGTDAHSGRAEYWLKESAKGGCLEALNLYGNRLIKDKDKANNRKGLKCLKKAAKKGHVQSRKDYIDYVTKKSKGAGDILGGILLCNVGISKVTDPYDKQLLSDDKKLLWEKILGPLGICTRKMLTGLVEVLVSLCLIIGALYFVLGVNAADLVESKMNFFPVNERFIIPLPFVWKWLDPFMDAHGKLGLEILLFSYFYISIMKKNLVWYGVGYYDRNLTGRICWFATILSYIGLVVGVCFHSDYSMVQYNHWFVMILAVVLTRLIPFVVGRIINEGQRIDYEK